MMLHQRRCRPVSRPEAENATKKLQTALNATSGPATTGIIIRNPDGTPFRVFWLDANENLMHRPFNGAFPALSRLDYRPTVYRKNCITTIRPCQEYT